MPYARQARVSQLANGQDNYQLVYYRRPNAPRTRPPSPAARRSVSETHPRIFRHRQLTPGNPKILAPGNASLALETVPRVPQVSHTPGGTRNLPFLLELRRFLARVPVF